MGIVSAASRIERYEYRHITYASEVVTVSWAIVIETSIDNIKAQKSVMEDLVEDIILKIIMRRQGQRVSRDPNDFFG